MDTGLLGMENSAGRNTPAKKKSERDKGKEPDHSRASHQSEPKEPEDLTFNFTHNSLALRPLLIQ
jgi:hypothetical protein